MAAISYQSLAAEALQRWPGLDPARVERAVKIAAKNTSIYNNHLPAGCYDVRSSSDRSWYRVNTHTHTCTCIDSAQGHICKHRLAVWLHIQARVRPLAEVQRVPQAQTMSELGYT